MKGIVKQYKQMHENAVKLILKGADQADVDIAVEVLYTGKKLLQGINYNLEANTGKK